MNTCNYCNAEGAQSVCGKCKSARYCSRDCQSADWTKHKIECTKVLEKKYFMESSLPKNFKIRCGFGCFCSKCSADVKPYKVLYSYQTFNPKQQKYVESALKTACDEIGDVKFEVVDVDRSPFPGVGPEYSYVPIMAQIMETDVMICDISIKTNPQNSEAYSSTCRTDNSAEMCAVDTQMASGGKLKCSPDKKVLREIKIVDELLPDDFNQKVISCINVRYGSPECLPVITEDGFLTSVVVFRANDESLEQCRENRQLIKCFQDQLMVFVHFQLENVGKFLVSLCGGSDAVSSMMSLIQHKLINVNKHFYVVFCVLLTQHEEEDLRKLVNKTQSTHVAFHEHFPVVTNPAVAKSKNIRQSSNAALKQQVYLRVSVQVLGSNYWNEFDWDECGGTSEPKHMDLLRARYEGISGNQQSSSSGGKEKKRDANVLYVFPNEGNEEVDERAAVGEVNTESYYVIY